MKKTPDEIKKGLSCCGLECADWTARCKDGCPYYPECDFGQVVVEDAISCIQQLQAENAQQARCIENLTDKLNAANDALPRWISVEERLPEYGKDHYVLCVVAHKNPEYKGRHVDVYEYDARPLWDGYSPHFDISGWANAEDLYVTHWMPLPEPPKEEVNHA